MSSHLPSMTSVHYFLAGAMLLTGSLNTLTATLANRATAVGEEGTPSRLFNHPFFQAACMFIGESLCFLAYKALVYRAHVTQTPNKDLETTPFNPLLFAIPALLDMCGTSTMYVGLTMTYTSVFQMLRSTTIIFTGVLSVIFLKRKLLPFHWFAMVLVIVGSSLVGVSSILASSDAPAADKPKNPLLGDICVVGSQMIVAVQMVVEEKLLSKYKIPALQAVGWEGIWGFMALCTLLVPMYYLTAIEITCLSADKQSPKTGCRMENAIDAWHQMTNNWIIVVALLGNAFSIAFFNYFGVSVTKVLSATHRMVIDSVRTIVVWFAVLAFGWEKLNVYTPIQVGGFVFLIAGTLLYNEVVKLPQFFQYVTSELTESLLETGEEQSLKDKANIDLSTRSQGGGRESAASVTLSEFRERGDSAALRGM